MRIVVFDCGFPKDIDQHVKALVNAGYKVVWTKDEQTALEAVRGGALTPLGGVPRILITEYGDVRGFQFTRKAVKIDPSLKVLLFTTHKTEELTKILDRHKDLGKFLPVSITPPDLLEAVESFLPLQ